VNVFIHRMLGHYLQNEAGADGGEGGGAAPAADAGADPAPADPASSQPPADGADPAAAASPDPVSYDGLSVGEGYELDAEVFESFKGLATELGISSEAAQKLLDLQTTMETKRADAYQAAMEQQTQRWADEIRNDKDLGGERFEQTQATAIKAIEKFGSPELRTLLNESGLGNHPELVKFCHRIGLSLTEDNFVLPGSQDGANPQQRTADVMFGDILKSQ